MNKKVLLILVDGMRGDSVLPSNHPFVNELVKTSCYTLNAQTVMPSVTLPCHMSLFHSVPSERHGIVTNTYMPQVRPVDGIVEQLASFRKTTAFFYNWEELRDLARPGRLSYSYYISGEWNGFEKSNNQLTDHAMDYIKAESPDFTFLYLGLTDIVGHNHGWMSEAYMNSITQSFDCIERISKSLSDEYVVIVTADHGGHGRGHGEDIKEDMTIPVFIYGQGIEAKELKDVVSIMDIAPTITKLIGVEANKSWEGQLITCN